jgi:hypothetical protein
MTELICFKKEDWDYLCDRLNFGKSFLDAKAIQILNSPIKKEDDE